MAQYDNTNRGTLGRNRSPKHSRSPNFTGKLDIKGIVFWLAGWEQEDFMSDDKHISLALTGKDDDTLKGTGRIAVNPDKMGSRPDMKGKVLVDGAEFEIAGWTKTSADKTSKFLSISVNTTSPAVAERNTTEPTGAKTYNEPPMDFDDDIPF